MVMNLWCGSLCQYSGWVETEIFPFLSLQGCLVIELLMEELKKITLSLLCVKKRDVALW